MLPPTLQVCCMDPFHSFTEEACNCLWECTQMPYQSMNFLQPTSHYPVFPSPHLTFTSLIPAHPSVLRSNGMEDFPIIESYNFLCFFFHGISSLVIFFIFMNFCLTYKTTNSLEAGPCLHIAYYCVPSTQHGTWLPVEVTKYLLADKGCCFIHSSPLGQTVLLIFMAFTDQGHTSPL